MAELIILLRRDQATGKQNIIVKLDSDPDSLPIEHEQLHRRLVEKLIGKGFSQAELGELVIEREPESPTAAPATESAPREPVQRKTSQNS